MFNCVGYCNYRYFFLFLAYMWLGCAYVCLCSLEVCSDPGGGGGPIALARVDSSTIDHQRGSARSVAICSALVCFAGVVAQPFMNRRMHFPGGRAARSNVTFMFVLTLSVGVAVTVLFFWHIYLVLSAQTTIEFYGNLSRCSRSPLPPHSHTPAVRSAAWLFAPRWWFGGFVAR